MLHLCTKDTHTRLQQHPRMLSILFWCVCARACVCLHVRMCVCERVIVHSVVLAALPPQADTADGSTVGVLDDVQYSLTVKHDVKGFVEADRGTPPVHERLARGCAAVSSDTCPLGAAGDGDYPSTVAANDAEHIVVGVCHDDIAISVDADSRRVVDACDLPVTIHVPLVVHLGSAAVCAQNGLHLHAKTRIGGHDHVPDLAVVIVGNYHVAVIVHGDAHGTVEKSILASAVKRSHDASTQRAHDSRPGMSHEGAVLVARMALQLNSAQGVVRRVAHNERAVLEHGKARGTVEASLFPDPLHIAAAASEASHGVHIAAHQLHNAQHMIAGVRHVHELLGFVEEHGSGTAEAYITAPPVREAGLVLVATQHSGGAACCHCVQRRVREEEGDVVLHVHGHAVNVAWDPVVLVRGDLLLQGGRGQARRGPRLLADDTTHLGAVIFGPEKKTGPKKTATWTFDVKHKHKHTHVMQAGNIVYPGSQDDITKNSSLYKLDDPPVGNVYVDGERPTATTVRLHHEGAHESLVTAKLMEERLKNCASMMQSTLYLMTQAAEHKSKFKEAVYKIRELVQTNPDFGRELRDVLAPVRAVIRSEQDEVDEDDKYERNYYRPVDGGGGAAMPLPGSAGVKAEAGAAVKAEAAAGVSDVREVGCKGKADGNAGGERQRRAR